MSSSVSKTRTCVKHGEQLLSAFYIYKTKTRTHYQCKLCTKIRDRAKRKLAHNAWAKYGREWRAKNKEKSYNYSQFHRLKAMTHVFTYFQTHPCVDCGEKDPLVLEFDHVRGKKHHTISIMVQSRYSIIKIQKEIDKCEVRCANCHRRKTVKQLGFYGYLDPKLLQPIVQMKAK